MKYICQLSLLVVLMLSSLSLVAQEVIDPGQAYFNQGNFEKAVEYWDAALSNILLEDNQTLYIDTSLRLATAYQALGRMLEAYKVLHKTQKKLNFCKDEQYPQICAKISMQLSDFYAEMRHFNKDRGSCEMKDAIQTVISNDELESTPKDMLNHASKYIDDALIFLSKVNDLEENSLLEAKILNRKGNILFLQSKLEDSSLNEDGFIFSLQENESKNSSNETTKRDCDKWKTCYENALKSLPTNNAQANMLRVKIELNLLQGILDNNDDEKSKTKLDDLKKLEILINNLPASHDKNFALISLAQLTRQFFFSGKDEKEDEEAFDKAKKLFDKEGKLFVHARLNNALEAAKEQQDRRSRIYALFELAKLYGLDKRYQESIFLLRKAIFHALNYPLLRNEFQKQLWGYPDVLYRLEWTLAEYLKKQSFYYTGTPEEHQEAIEKAYKNATKHIDDMEVQYTVLPEDFNTEKERLFFEYANVLLKKAHRMVDVTDEQKAKKQKVLKEAIKTIESSKVAEVKDYLQDSCLTKELEEQVEHLDDNLPSNVAIFYPLLFEDRIEFLVITDDGIMQETKEHEMSLEDTELDINELRYKISGNSKNDYDTSLQKISGWFEDIFPKLEKKEIITIIPGGDMRRIPFAALYYYDKKNKKNIYLIKKYALVITPSIKLTNNAPSIYNHNLLLAGAYTFSKKDKLANLCHTTNELISSACIFQNQQDKVKSLGKSICLNKIKADCLNCSKGDSRRSCNTDNRIDTHSKLIQCLKDKREEEKNCTSDNMKVLLEKDFTSNELRQYVSENKYSTIHISTHGIFQDNPTKTVLYTSDGNNITMPKLHEIISSSDKTNTLQGRSLDLLILSACQSATGNNEKRAELGFASVAISSGSSSVLGTLWSVKEKPTQELINKFYKNYYINKCNKAESLQKAIIYLIDEKKLLPSDWASFVLIGKGF